MADRPCPSCAMMRPEAATFCSNCGQDLRPGAALGAKRPGATIVRKLPPGGAPTGASAAVPPASIPSQPLPTAAPSAAGPGRPRLIRPSRGASPGPAARPGTTPANAAPDPRSFRDRYSGTQFETPEARALRPAGATSRLVRLGAALILVLLVVAVAGYGALQVLAPGAASATPSGSGVAQASGPLPSPVQTPVPAIGFTPAQTAQVAFCLAAQETHGLDADIATARAAVDAVDHPTVAADAAALATRIGEMRLAAQEMAGLPILSAYASAYDTGLKAVGAAASALSAAGTASDAKAEVKAATALATAQTKLHTSDAQRATLVTANPVLACTAAG